MHDAPYDDDDMEISTDGRDLSDALHLPTENRVFYHGTSKRNARRILREGLRDWSWTESTPKIKYKVGEGTTRWLHDGMYGRGTYVSCNWRVALYFGPVMFRVELQPGTRLLRLDVPPRPTPTPNAQQPARPANEPPAAPAVPQAGRRGGSRRWWWWRAGSCRPGP